MLEHMRNGCPSICPDDARAMHERTNATDATDVRIQDQGKSSHLPDAPTPVDNPVSVAKWIIRKRFSNMYGAPGMYWRVTHPSLPAYFGHSFHLYSFEDALEYVLDHIDGREVAS